MKKSRKLFWGILVVFLLGTNISITVSANSFEEMQNSEMPLDSSLAPSDSFVRDENTASSESYASEESQKPDEISSVIDSTQDIYTANGNQLEIIDISGNETKYKISLNLVGHTNIKSLQFPTWSQRNGQDDIRWYKATYNNQTQKWEKEISISDHKDGGLFHVHAYVEQNNGKMVQISTIEFSVSTPVMTAEIQNINTEKATFQVRLNVTSPSGVKELTVPIWSEANQSNIVWYKAIRQADGSYLVNFDYKNHQYKDAKYRVDAYLTAGNGLKSTLNLGSVDIPHPPIYTDLTVQDVNGKETTYLISAKVENIDRKEIKQVEFPTWSDHKGQDDIKWYQATYNSKTDRWEKQFKIADHKDAGKYHIHMYVKDQNNRMRLGGTSIINITPPTVSSNIIDPDKEDGKFIVEFDVSTLSGVRELVVPIWSKANQSDIVWYQAQKQSNGKYRVEMNYRNHKYSKGNYVIDAYLRSNNGVETPVSVGKVNVQEPPVKSDLSVQDINGKETTYLISVKIGNIDPKDIKQVEFPTWSDHKGQDDIKWYQGTYNSKTDRWERQFKITDHKDAGKYNIHMYVKDQNNQMRPGGKATISVSPMQLKGEISDSNTEDGKFTVEFEASSVSGIKELSVPIWSKANQSDIVWYQAQKQSNGKYRVEMNYKNHKFSTGTYNVDAYLHGMNGLVTSIQVGKINLSEPKIKCDTTVKDTDNKETTYLISAKVENIRNENIAQVEFPTWSAKNGQDDIRWYKGEYNKSTGRWEKEIRIADHGDAGEYRVDTYIRDRRGKMNWGASNKFTVTTPKIEGKINEENLSKGRFSVEFKLTSPSGIKELSVPVWGKTNQGDLIWYQAQKQSNGTYRVDVDYQNHDFTVGNYIIHAYLTANNGIKHSVNVGNVKINIEWPKRIQSKGTQNIYSDVELTEVKRKVEKGTFLSIKGVVFKKNGERVYRVSDGYISADDSSYTEAGAAQYVAHRGNHRVAPENSIPAFENANHWGVETDIHLSKDKKWVIMHDDSVDRMTNGSGLIRNFDLNQLRNFKFDTGANISKYPANKLVIPTLDEYLSITKQKGQTPIIEIKCLEASAQDYDNLTNQIKNKGYENNVCIISFYYHHLQEIRKRMPSMEVMYLTYAINDSTIDQVKALGSNAHLNVLYADSTVTAANIQKAHNNGMKVGVWTVPSNQFAALEEKGVDYITTDD